LIVASRRGVEHSARRRVGVRRLTGVAVVVTLAIPLLAACDSSTSPAAGRSSSAEASYGSLPTFLPSATIEPDSVLTGTVAHPALTTEGDSVRVQLADQTVLATVDGPVVPGEGLPYQTPATTCTWTVTLAGATQPLPIDIADFTSIDHLGAVYHAALVPGQPAPPAQLEPGQTTTFELRAVMPTGEGLMRWAPGGQQIVASWDFEVEND
jgi:hypothetical protein